MNSRTEVFLDAAYAIALSSSGDQHHARAVFLAKEWGMTDCLSFIVMQDRGMTEALTTDEHFQQAGFRALLREE